MHAEAAISSEFPSVLSAEPQGLSTYQAALFHLRQGLQALSDLSPGDDADKQQAHEDLLALQKQVLQLLHIHFSPVGETEGARRFGDVLRQHRDEAGLTQAQLAEYTGLSESLVRKLEAGLKAPSQKTLLALCTIPELRLVPSEITATSSSRDQGHRLAPNWYVSPGFDSVQMISELAQQLNSNGGSVEQTYVYLDHKSAYDWIQLCNSPRYSAAFRDQMPHSAMAKRVAEILGPVGLDVIALGPGDGRNEVRLVQHILEQGQRPNLRFYLLDASQPLLSYAFKHAVDTFSSEPSVFVCGLQGNFHHLPRYLQLHYSPARSHRRRLYLMMGGTIGNLDHEPQFFQNSFAGAAPGDLILFDVSYPATESMDPEQIERSDTALRQPIPEAHQHWLAGPIRRYCQDAQSVAFRFRLDTNRPLAGSYGMQFMAMVTLPGNERREFCMWQVRRYQPESLVRCMRGLGWRHVGLLPFGGTSGPQKAVFIFQRDHASPKH